MEARAYRPSKIEKKWQKKWESVKIFSPNLDPSTRSARSGQAPSTSSGQAPSTRSARSGREPYYNLMMFPYPSAEGLHVGNMYAFTGADIWGRYQRMKGYDVFQPIGLDGFGIHSENYAIKVGEHPRDLAKKTQKRFYKQLHATGNAYDWTRTLETYHPDYYRWTQWLFVQMFKRGLAYRQKSPVNWCPSCKTVLADEQVIAGRCERCSTVVELRRLEQWFFKITDYADRLLSNLEKIDWPERIKNAQRNWIGRSEGAEIRFPLKLEVRGEKLEIPTFTTRPDTLFGATFMVLSLDSEWIEKVTTRGQKQKVSKYLKSLKRTSNVSQQTLDVGKANKSDLRERTKTGIFTGSYAVNPATGEEIPIWVANYVVGGYGSGAIMAVPAHDERDFEFAQKYNLPVKKVIEAKKLPYTGKGKIVNSGDWDGWKTPQDMGKVFSWLEKEGAGEKGVSYHLRDWLISRQRYWGPPIPMIYCEKCQKEGRGEKKDMPGWFTVPEKELPVKLPYVENYQPRGTGESPLAQDKEFIKAECPGCGNTAQRETDVSDTFLDSSWYFFRYISTEDDTCPWKPERARKWLPVHMYIGGAEHSVLHLMYARFVTMAFRDWGLISHFEEPFSRFYAHGLMIAEGAKMSKSRGNVIIPDDYIKKLGADTLRAYLMFLGPFDQGGDFRDTGIEGMYRFVKRVWELVVAEQDLVLSEKEDSQEVLRRMHQTIKRVTEDMESLRYNRAIAGLMEYVNFLRDKASSAGSASRARQPYPLLTTHDALRTLVLLLAPFAPHMSEELWQFLRKSQAPSTKSQTNSKLKTRNSKLTGNWQLENGKFISVHLQPWPSFEPELAKEEILEIPVQVDGRLRATVKLPQEEAHNKELVEAKAKDTDGAGKHLKGKKLKKVVFVPGKLINFVTS